jgi:uncharacterized protein with PIN domain
MAVVELRFEGSLHDLLPGGRRELPIIRSVVGTPSVKDVLEAAGVPHVEIGSIIVDGEPVGFARRVRGGERITVFPVLAAGEPQPPEVMASPAGELRFVVDGHLGRLAAYLRMLGFDTTYEVHTEDAELAGIAAREDRILLSRDRGLLKRSIVRRGCFLRSDRPHDQLREVDRRYGLGPVSHPFTRCMRCNGLLGHVDPDVARAQVPPRVAREQSTFRRCRSCGALYWRGSHHTRMRCLIDELVPEASRS